MPAVRQRSKWLSLEIDQSFLNVLISPTGFSVIQLKDYFFSNFGAGLEDIKEDYFFVEREEVQEMLIRAL